MAGNWYALIPEAGTNIVLDGSAESFLASGGATYTAENGATVTQDTAYSRFGFHSYKVVLGTTNRGLRVTTAPAANAIHYYTFYVHGAVTGALQVSMDGGSTYNAAAIIGGQLGGWVRYGVSIPAAQANTSTSTRIRDTLDDGTLYIDGIMCQAVNYATTFIGGYIPGCRWTGLANQSTSTRDAQYRQGGRLIDIEATYGVKITQAQGIGAAPQVNDFQALALQPGAQFNSTKIQPRVLTLIIAPATAPATAAAWHLIRKSLINLFNPDYYRSTQPVTLAYFGANAATGVYCDFRYDGGLEYGEVSANVEKVAIRLIAENPFWRVDGQENAALGQNADLASNNYAVARIDGAWQNLGTGFNNVVNAIAIDKVHNRIYYGGLFTTANGVTVNRICYWDGYLQTFVAMDAGVGNGNIFAICIAANGDVWIGGSFTTVGSGATATSGMARWNFATSTWTAFNPAGITLGAIGVEAISIAPDTGDVYIGGAFTDAGDANGDAITMYDVSAGTFVSLGTGMNDGVNALIAVSSTKVYVGGAFTTGNGVTLNRIGYWNGTTFVAMAGGASHVIYTIVVASNGDVYMGGAFPSTPAVAYIARWNGTAWSALGTGTNDLVYRIAISDSGEFIVGGTFTIAGGVNIADRIAIWNGSSWTPLDINLPGTPIVYACAFNGNDIYLGYGTAGTAVVASVTGPAVVSPSSTTLTYPIIVLYGSTTANALMTVQWIENYSLRCRIYLNMIVQAGERVIFDFTPGKKKITSSVRGDITGDVLSPSEFVKFALLPGSNTLNTYITGTITGAIMAALWTPMHISADGVAV